MLHHSSLTWIICIALHSQKSVHSNFHLDPTQLSYLQFRKTVLQECPLISSSFFLITIHRTHALLMNFHQFCLAKLPLGTLTSFESLGLNTQAKRDHDQSIDLIQISGGKTDLQKERDLLLNLRACCE